jgi:hypothetical protein
MLFLENSFYKLKTNGIYIIEDIVYSEIPKYEILLNYLKEKLNFTYEIKKLNFVNNNCDNCLILINNKKLLNIID